jgi:hypothetical protein
MLHHRQSLKIIETAVHFHVWKASWTLKHCVYYLISKVNKLLQDYIISQKKVLFTVTVLRTSNPVTLVKQSSRSPVTLVKQSSRSMHSLLSSKTILLFQSHSHADPCILSVTSKTILLLCADLCILSITSKTILLL